MPPNSWIDSWTTLVPQSIRPHASGAGDIVWRRSRTLAEI